MRLTIFDVQHGACALVQSTEENRIALIDCGTNSSTGWVPADYIEDTLGRNVVDYLLITNADQDHYANLAVLKERIRIETFIGNRSLKEGNFERIKEESGPLSSDALAYQSFLQNYNTPADVPFDSGMGGITLKTFYNKYPKFTDTNNLSVAAFLNYNGFQILFPGDLERPGWLELLQNSQFTSELKATTILVAPHHGRENGYCEEVFQIWGPKAVVVSDKPIMHETQNVPQYQNCLSGDGITVIGQSRKRHVLTTRKDGAITFEVGQSGGYDVYTTKN